MLVPSERVSMLELQNSVLKKTARDRAERIIELERKLQRITHTPISQKLTRPDGGIRASRKPFTHAWPALASRLVWTAAGAFENFRAARAMKGRIHLW
jgi:hypothetical protein